MSSNVLVEQFRSAAEQARCRVIEVSADEVGDAVLAEYAGGKVIADQIPALAGVELPAPPADPWEATVGIAQAFGGAGETGTVALVRGPGAARRSSLLPTKSVVLLDAATIHPTYAELVTAVAQLQPRPSNVQFVTGASRSGDIESAMVHGMHGPVEVVVIITT
jgi:L-lactate utilization protein LutC